MQTVNRLRGVAFVVAFLFASTLVSARVAVAAVPAIEHATDAPSLTLKSRRAEWLKASPTQRIKIAEDIGEEGAEALMKRRSLQPLLTRSQKTLRQGLDQVWVNPKTGHVIVVEAKGGTSALNRGYGHVQGTPEWAVAAAKKTLKRSGASEAEKNATKCVLKATGAGKMRVEVVRTEHVLGKPRMPRVEKLSNTSDDAARMARGALDELAGVHAGGRRVARNAAEAVRAVGGSSDDAGRAAAKSVDDVGAFTARALAQSSDDAVRAGAKVASGAAKVARGVAKAAPVVAMAVEAGIRGKDAWDTEHAYRAGEITAQARAGRHGRNAGACAGGVVGAWAGAKGGALIGAGIGALCGGVGAPIGAAVGGIMGAIGGAIAGDRAGAMAGGALGKELAD